MFKFGDWVVFVHPHSKPALGRVASYNWETHTYQVCFHSGCTASRCDARFLTFATEREIKHAPKGIGYHRFDSECPDYCGLCAGLACNEVLRRMENIAGRETE